MITPNPIQAEIIADDPHRYMLSAGCGVGKTLLALWLSEGRVLVVSPKINRIDDKELNNFDRKEVTEDFGDSNFADRV